jgi:leucyl aminopeptidase
VWIYQNVEVHFISAICENMVSAEAMRPGDVLVASNQKTIEVINTDAEGRLTLADALVYAEKLQVDAIVDLATLTGRSRGLASAIVPRAVNSH